MSASSEGSGSGPVDILQSTETPPPVKKEDPYLGKTIDGRYLIEAVLGEGGMGVVYRARHKVIDKRVAMKVLKREMARDQEVTQRFLQEARAASAIGNPHIVDISDFGQMPDGATYFVMEFLDGRGLSKAEEEVRPAPLPIKRLVAIARQIAEALAAAHAAGIVHRDLKPDNVMLVRRGSEADFVKLLDFGIAKVGGTTGETARLTRAGAVFGTPHYMSPEQAAGTTVDKRTDIYSLGVMLYEMAAAKPPFDAENFMGIMTMHMYKQPAPIRALVPPPQDVPPGLEAIIMKCLSKKPELRYESAEALIEDLDRFNGGQIPKAVEEMMARSGGFAVPADYFRHSQMPPAVPGTPPERRKPWGLYAGIAGVVTAIVIVGAVFAKSGATSAKDTPVTKDPGTPTTSAVVSAPPPPSTPAAKVTKPVAVAVDPSDAKVERDGVELKNPVVLQLADGETATLKITRAGYVAQTLSVDATEPSRLVKLAVVAAAKPSATTKPTTTKQGGSGEFVDLWKK